MKIAIQLGAFGILVLALCMPANGQDGGDNGGFDPGNVDPNQIVNGGTNETGDFSTVGDFSPDVPEIEDLRGENGFVGRTRERIEEQGFVGPTKELIESVSGASNAGGGGNFGGGGGGFGAAADNGFTVSRSSVRARVRPNFSFPTVSPQTIQEGFQRRVQRLPNLRTGAPMSIQVKVEGTTATLTGRVVDQESIDNMVGQLRMEPGIYRIVNQVELVPANQIGQQDIQTPTGRSPENLRTKNLLGWGWAIHQ